jgi:hypothetical protein
MEDTSSKKNFNEHISIISTGSSEANDGRIPLEIEESEKRFSMRKRRNVNYNSKTKKFEYDDDSDYEQTPRKKYKKK